MNEHIINSRSSADTGRIVRPNLQSGNPSNRTPTTANLHSTSGNTTSGKRTRKEKLEDIFIFGVGGSGFLWGLWLTIQNYFLS